MTTENAVEAAWRELERQSEEGKPGPYVDRALYHDAGLVDGRVDMRALVNAAMLKQD